MSSDNKRYYRKHVDFFRLLEKINKEEGTTILIVTHDSTIVKHHPKRMIALDSGHIVADLAKGGSIG